MVEGKRITQEEEKALRELFSCPGMPVFLLKNKDIDIVCPPDMVQARYSDKMEAIAFKFAEDSDADETPKIYLKSLKWPSLQFALKIDKNEAFSLFHAPHRQIAGKLIEMFMTTEPISDLLSLAVYCRERLNAFLFSYALTTALMHRSDTKHIRIPDISENFPAKFHPKSAINKCRETIYLNPKQKRPAIQIPFENVMSNVSPELKMNYFREDICVNQHHWHWHVIYPAEGPLEVVKKDRRGELFYYMHNQIIRRYDNDRICVGLSPVLPLEISHFNKCEEGYYPKLDSSLGSRYIAGRPDFADFQDVNQDGLVVTTQKLELWLNRIRNCISKGYIELEDDKVLKLTLETGCDEIGNLLEANSTLSKNYGFYGDAHNYGHILLANMHDPNQTYKELPGIMGDVTTAMRDPIFYRWHKTIDLVVQDYKNTLPHYVKKDLQCPGLSVKKVEVCRHGKSVDELNTFWEIDDVDVSRGLDFASSESVFVQFKHLNHTNFSLDIKVQNKSKDTQKVSVRIWLIPETDNSKNPINLARMQNLAIEMDKFVATVKPGESTINRKSCDSNLTLSFERSFPNRYKAEKIGKVTEDESWCTCGWPHHMYLPIGSIDGIQFFVFVMLTPFEKDKVESKDVASDTSIYCGLKDKKYPDRRPMNFPFDRIFDTDIKELDDLVDTYDNMATTKISIRHLNETRSGKFCSG